MAVGAIVFDLDNTLAPSKAPVTAEMSVLLESLLKYYPVGVISGGSFEQFQRQLLGSLAVSPDRLWRLHLMPACGTRYYRYEPLEGDWEQQYAEDFTADEKALIADVLLAGASALNLLAAEPFGDIVEDRGGQMTFSALGQYAPIELRSEWDPDCIKRRMLAEWAAPRLPGLDVRVGGTTSVDVTRAGIDKAYGMRKLLNALGLARDEVIYVGDRLHEGGNDYPVLEMGIRTLAVRDHNETANLIRRILLSEAANPVRIPVQPPALTGSRVYARSA
ncbi:MAG: HAD-IIB family hydrolase [Gammaproteobacteria bacterium]|nr:HAD-IIB family hydrolase [Gammaproteobacteria bacterium]